jgi:DNA repair photolyase
VKHFAKYRYALSPTSQVYFCGLPFRLDTTPKCTLNCLYCFAMSRGGRRTSRKLIAYPDSIARKLHRVLDNQEQRVDIVGEMLSRKVPIHFGGISDPFSNPSVAAISRELLIHFSNYKYPVVISTKNTNLLLEDKTMKIITGMKNIVIQVSFTSLDSEKTRLIEPNVPTTKARLQCIDTLSKESIHVIARLQPLFPSFESYVAENLIPSLGSLGCKHVAVEYLKLPVEKNISLIKRIFNIMNWDGFDFYHHNHSLLVGREWVLPNEFKWERLQALIKSIHKYGMTYGSADYGLNHMGDTDCCCGIDNVPGFGNWFKGNFSNIIRHAPSQELTFHQLNDYWFPRGSVKMYMNSNCRLAGNNQIISYLLQKWNSPGTANAPDSFLGVTWNGDRDAIGNCIYTIKEDLCKPTRSS